MGSKNSNDNITSKINKYLTFKLDKEEYGLEILKVREIIGLIDITRVPKMPNFIKGVINLRGRVLPVIDLRLKFKFESVQNTEETCIIIVDTGEILTGIIVDKVQEVLDISEENIENAPEFGINLNTDFILGIGKVKSRIIIILDIIKVLTFEEIGMLKTVN